MTELSFPRELEPFDHLMLKNEHDPRGRSGFLAVSILESQPDPQAIREVYDRASRVVVRLRQKVVVPTIPIAPPEWVIDPAFDLDRHVHEVTVPSPGGLRQLLDLAQPILAAPFDLTRPLWELHIVTGLREAGEAAVLMKTHHAVMDGLAAVELFKQVFDFTPEADAERPSRIPAPAPETTSGADLTRAAVQRLPASTLTGAARLMTDAIGTVTRFAQAPSRSTVEAAKLLQSARRVFFSGPPARPSPLLRNRSADRRFELVDFDLEDLRAVAKAAGGSINDAYLAGVCAVLRRYHEALDSPVDELPLALPISTRTEADPAGGNRFAGAAIAAPVGELDPAKRIRRIGALVRAAKGEPALTAMNGLMPLVVRLPSPMLAAMASMVTGIDVQASNVPGYPVPVYLGGIKVVRTFGFGPVPGVAAMITMSTMAGRCEVTANSDTAA
ncbi:MAG: wax ester/triacylglycerol synthase domain-containing protein, partial [Acidimicrobiales bacterium]